MIEDLKEIEKQIDRLWHDIKRVRDELTEHPEDTSNIDFDLIDASRKLVGAEDLVRLAQGKLEALGAVQQDENIHAAIALLESKGFIVGTKT